MTEKIKRKNQKLFSTATQFHSLLSKVSFFKKIPEFMPRAKNFCQHDS